ncbi:hypothetical protein [Synechocystis sp. PCC 7509]|nr:hypothetical protein [Synechocystis sp. PCC 7509]
MKSSPILPDYSVEVVPIRTQRCLGYNVEQRLFHLDSLENPSKP